MTHKRNCINNCIIEMFFGALKREMFYVNEQKFQALEQLKQAIVEYMNYYNKRIKGKAKWTPPINFREASILTL